ncbi:uroporphyrinogen decarboxylase family protein [Candidatus Latescibacterota bacterium]
MPVDLLKRKSCQVPLEAIGILKKRLGDEIAVLGKAFGPWTLGYHLFGVEEFLINTLLKPNAVKRAMDVLKEVTVAFALAQVDSGADVICFPDHATRDLCSPDNYRDFLLDIHREISERITCPVILHICGDTSDRIGYIRETGIECFHYDSKVSAPKARQLAGEKLSLMGGSSNFDVVLYGTHEIIEKDVEEKLSNKIDIIGPECAVPLNAPYENMKIMAAKVKSYCLDTDS